MTPRATHSRRSSRPSLVSQLEALETRVLLSAISNYQVDDILGATSAAVDPSGNLWVGTQTNGVQILHKNADNTVTATPTEITSDVSYSMAYDAATHEMIVSTDGTLYEMGLNGTIANTYNLPEAPSFVTTATDGSVWFTTDGNFSSDSDSYTQDIGRLNLATGEATYVQLPIGNTQSLSLKAAPDGSVWFGTSGVDFFDGNYGLSYLARATSTSTGVLNVTMYNIPDNVGTVTDVAVASDNTVWYGLAGDSNSFATRPAVTEGIGHATLAGSTLNVTEYALPKQSSEGVVYPGALTFDSSGQLWFSDYNAIDTLDPSTGDITRMNPNNDGAVRSGLAISGTDVWAPSNGGDTNLADISLASYTAPVEAISADVTTGVGQPISAPVAVFASSDAGDFAYTIDFGNGATQSGTLAHSDSGMYTINGTTTYAAAGTYNTQVTITSATGDTALVNGQATVTDIVTIPLVSQGVNLQAQRGQAIAANVSGVAQPVVAQFSGPAANYTATINWGDSTSTVGQIVSLGNGQYYVEIPSGSSKSYATAGTFNVSVLITDGTNSTTATSTATISAVPVTASQNLTLQPLLGGIVLTSVGNFTADASSTANWFKATITWGDGTKSAGLVVRTAAGSYSIIGLHFYTKKGTYSVSTSIIDSVDVESATATATIKIK